MAGLGAFILSTSSRGENGEHNNIFFYFLFLFFPAISVFCLPSLNQSSRFFFFFADPVNKTLKVNSDVFLDSVVPNLIDGDSSNE
uniref:Uncharacterized protein n=1 Tax=Salix viminalis TaxID=40686 RepID=A0A6N2LT42_SALVM